LPSKKDSTAKQIKKMIEEWRGRQKRGQNMQFSERILETACGGHPADNCQALPLPK